MHASLTPEEEVARAAVRRAAALADRDEAALRLLMHPDLQWTTFQGEVLGYEVYITGNPAGTCDGARSAWTTSRWRSSRIRRS
jgi:hypothetical protein